MRSSKKKILLSLAVIFLLFISAAVPASAESSTVFTFHLEDVDNAPETTTQEPLQGDHAGGIVSPQTGDEPILTYLGISALSAGCLLAILCIGKLKSVEKRNDL